MTHARLYDDSLWSHTKPPVVGEFVSSIVQYLALATLLLGLLASARAPAQSIPQCPTPTQSATSPYTLCAITTAATAPSTGRGRYGPLALNDSGLVVYYRDGEISPGDFYDIYQGDGTTTPNRVYESPQYQSSSTIVGANNPFGVGFPGVNDSDYVTFAGEITPGPGALYTCGIYGLSPGSSTAEPLSTGTCYGTAFPSTPSGLSQSGTVAFLENGATTGQFAAITNFTQGGNYTALDSAFPYPESLYVSFSPPAINSNNEVVLAYNMQAPGGYPSPYLNFYGAHQVIACDQVALAQVCSTLSAALGGQGAYINLTNGNSPGPYSAPTLNDLDYSAVIVAPGASTAVSQWALYLVSFGTVGKATVYPLVQAGTSGSQPYGGVLCSTPAINIYNEVVFISGSSTSGGACNAALWVVDNSVVDASGNLIPQQIVAQGQEFTDLSGTSWTITSIIGTGQQSINSAGSIAVEVMATPTASPGPVGTAFILRADPAPGSSPASPIIPPTGGGGTGIPIKTTVQTEYFCTFGGGGNPSGGPPVFYEVWNGTSWVQSPDGLSTSSASSALKSDVGAIYGGPWCRPIYVDPELASGYTYAVPAGAPQFAGVYIPVALAHGQSTFNVSYGGFTGTVQAGTPFNFLTQVPSGVGTFTLSGISPTANVDATNPTAFTAGLIFVPATASNSAPLAITVTPLVATVPFSSFSAKLDIYAGSPPGFDTSGSFTLGVGSDGIKPLSEPVLLQLGTFSTTIPAGSFTKNSKGDFVFQGNINGVSLQVQIAPLSANSFSVKVDGKGVDLTRLTNPVTVVLTIGNDGGSTTTTANIG